MSAQFPRLILHVVEVLGGFTVEVWLRSGRRASDVELILEDLVGSLPAVKEIGKRVAKERGIDPDLVQTFIKLDSLGALKRSLLN